MASELWEATGDQTIPTELSLDHVRITVQGRAILLDEPWPDAETQAERIEVGDFAGQQRFLNAIAECVESTSMPHHARAVLHNLAGSKFEKLSFLTVILRVMLDKPVEVSRGIRAGSIFMLGLYVWIAVLVGYYQAERIQQWNNSLGWLILICAMVVLDVIAMVQLLEIVLFRTTAGHAIFRLAVINASGRRVNRVTLLRRWAIVWLPLFVPMLFVALLIKRAGFTAAFFCSFTLLCLWIIAAVYAVVHPNRGIHDRLADTWVVRQ